MTTSTDNGVKVSVETFYRQDYSNPQLREFMFAYRVTIENKNDFPIIVHGRQWNIFDSMDNDRIVEGDGIVGSYPFIRPGEEYQYVSGCNLRSEMGTMFGQYTVENVEDKTMFKVAVHRFQFIAPFKMN